MHSIREHAGALTKPLSNVLLFDVGLQEDRAGQYEAPNSAARELRAVSSDLDGCSYRKHKVSYWSHWIDMRYQKQPGRCTGSSV